MDSSTMLYQFAGTMKQVNGPGEIFLSNELTPDGRVELLEQIGNETYVLGTFTDFSTGQAAFRRMSHFHHPITRDEVLQLAFGTIKQWNDIERTYEDWTANCMSCDAPVRCTPYYNGPVWCNQCYNEHLALGG